MDYNKAYEDYVLGLTEKCRHGSLTEIEQGILELVGAERDLRAENERLEDLFERLNTWTKAYPLSVFPKPDLKKAHKLLKAGGITLDAISADAMRHVLKGIYNISAEALKGN